MKIWLDDERNPPNKEWTIARTGEECIDILKQNDIQAISFDHDLGDGMTGYEVAKWIEEMASHGAIEPIPSWTVHSANPVGKRNIEAAMRAAEKFWVDLDEEEEERDDYGQDER